MKKTLSITAIFALAILLTSSSLWLLNRTNSLNSIHANPDIELFVAEFLFEDYEVFEVEGEVHDAFAETWKSYPATIWQPNDSIAPLPVKWIIDEAEFEAADSVSFGIQNTSSSKFYYMSWGAPNSRLRIDYFVHRGDSIESLPFSGFGCATGIFLAPLEHQEKAIGTEYNPLLTRMFHYEIDSLEEFIEIPPTAQDLKLAYGDSVSLQFSLGTYSLPWSSYEPQLIQSERITVNTDRLVEAYDKRTRL